MTVYTWIAKGAWFALGYPYDFIVTPVWLPSAMLLGFGLLGNKEEQTLVDTVWRRTGRNVITDVQHGKPDNSSRPA